MPKGPGGKPPRSVPAKKLTVNVSEPLFAEVKVLLFDPVYQRAKYGSVSGLIEELLQKWVENRRNEVRRATTSLASPERRAFDRMETHLEFELGNFELMSSPKRIRDAVKEFKEAVWPET